MVNDFLEKHELEVIVRAHQVVEDGYEFYFNRKLVTVFSAANYCGEFTNAGAMMTVSEHMVCSFRVLKPLPKSQLNEEKRVSTRKSKNRTSLCNPKRLSVGRVSIDELVDREKTADRNSFFHRSFFGREYVDRGRSTEVGMSAYNFDDLDDSEFKVVKFSNEPPKILTVEDLTRRSVSYVCTSLLIRVSCAPFKL